LTKKGAHCLGINEEGSHKSKRDNCGLGAKGEKSGVGEGKKRLEKGGAGNQMQYEGDGLNQKGKNGVVG